MIERKCENWKTFETRMEDFFAKGTLYRNRFVFRGMGDSTWGLTTTLDRFLRLHGLTDREAARTLLHESFREQAFALSTSIEELDDETLPLLARHHGLPSTIMDWTHSPYVAAYFAFSDETHDGSFGPTNVAIWCLDLEDTWEPFGDNVQVIDDSQSIRLIPRAIEQRSVFVDFRHPIDLSKLPNESLRKFVIPATERKIVLARLDGMGINRRSLFRSLEGAAGVAAWRTWDTLTEKS